MTSRSLTILSAPLLAIFLTICAFGQEVQTNPRVSYDVRHDVSLPLRDMARNAPRQPSGTVIVEPERRLGLTVGLPGEDTVVQDVYLAPGHVKQVMSLEGTREDQGNAQVPDTNGAIGATQFVEITNFDYEIFDKTTGKVILKPTNTNTLFSNFGGLCQGTNPGDPVVLWDHLANRWLLTYFNYSGNNALCIAMSTTEDATGTYNRYEFDYGGTLPDYPKYAVWPDAYYGTVNSFGSGAAEPCAYDRTAMLAGKKAAVICFAPNSNNFSFLPSDLDGSTMPPKGAPNHYVELGNSTNQLSEYDFHVDFAHPKKSTFTGPNNIKVPSFSLACGGGDCIPQPSPGEEVESLGDRLLFRLAYRNFGDHEAMVVAHAVSPGKGSSAVSAMRWYELRATPAGGTFSLYQAGTFQNQTASLWMGAVGMDKVGNIALGMSASSDTVKPSIWYTGRQAGDPLGKMEAPVVAIKGTAVQIGDSARWGDYSSMSMDPSDDCTFWYAQMYYNKKHGGNSSGDWSTHIFALKFDSCH